MLPSDYERATALITQEVLVRGIAMSFPALSAEDRDAMFIGVLDRIARLRGWAVKREHILSEEQGE